MNSVLMNSKIASKLQHNSFSVNSLQGLKVPSSDEGNHGSQTPQRDNLTHSAHNVRESSIDDNVNLKLINAKNQQYQNRQSHSPAIRHPMTSGAPGAVSPLPFHRDQQGIERKKSAFFDQAKHSHFKMAQASKFQKKKRTQEAQNTYSQFSPFNTKKKGEKIEEFEDYCQNQDQQEEVSDSGDSFDEEQKIDKNSDLQPQFEQIKYLTPRNDSKGVSHNYVNISSNEIEELENCNQQNKPVTSRMPRYSVIPGPIKIMNVRENDLKKQGKLRESSCKS